MSCSRAASSPCPQATSSAVMSSTDPRLAAIIASGPPLHFLAPFPAYLNVIARTSGRFGCASERRAGSESRIALSLRPAATIRRCVMRPCFPALLAAAFLFAALPTDAQVLSGALVGTAKDEHGAVLQGAVVRVTSPALIGGPATTTTNERGQLRFPILPPGTYALDIELPGFATYHEADVTIGVGATLERTVELKVAGVAESVVVEGSGSRIEARSSGFETRFKAEDFQAIPTRRFSMVDFIRAAPGVSPTSP